MNQAPERAANGGGGIAPEPRRALLAWCFFDWANSPFPTIIVTFVFSAYYASAVAASPTAGTAEWAQAMAISGVVIAILSPVFGAIADQCGARKPWLACFSALCMVATALLWFVRPDPAYALLALILFSVANTGFEIGAVFYNAMLPDLADERRIGRWSGWGWGIGYAGGLVCLVVALVVFVQNDPPIFGLDKTSAEPVRAIGPLVAVWLALFAAPIFFLAPDRARTGLSIRQAVGDGLRAIYMTARNMRRHGNIGRFMLARLFYTDGLNTLFAFGGIYAAGAFGMSVAEIIQFGIAMNLTAGLGAALFAWVDDRIGAKKTILIALIGMIGFGVPLLLAEEKLWFWILALGLGTFMGPAQAASRSLMARLAPKEASNEMFGLFALSGRITGFLGPALLAWATLHFESQRAGMATVMGFLLIGLVLLTLVREKRRAGA